MAGLRSFGSRLYRGEVEVDFVGRRRLWYRLSALLLVLSLAGVVSQEINLGIEFRGGSVFTFRAPSASIEEVRAAVTDAGGRQVIVQSTTSGWRVATENLPAAEITRMQHSLAERFESEVSVRVIGGTWGGEVSRKALIGLGVFMLAIVLYLTVAFEWKMALAAVVALVHDLVITAGVYAWSNFEVTPATVLGFLTILGYSLYDVVVVFDMIKEVTARLGPTSKITYSMAANDALNHTLIRSLNTSLVAILPVAAILLIGTTLLGAGTLKDLSLALLVGMIVGTYSSLCVATPILATLKEREPGYREIARRAARRNARRAQGGRRGGGGAGTPAGTVRGGSGPFGNGGGRGRR
ncbi:protein translocase subunit SecF [Thermostaphylospora chromogena]|uniref:Protein-export membrane protein SecF n=1 Tax=Thermostaphylospora chromogena TaxID=35622 RepID=A0A1H1HNG4_9ACTN|nr:protein translocase subunit SecF [Thermostaphylospora chromogena]SDR26933.1 preprotein translocase subunit SecF [Thermostaphylospora chromogena]